MENVRDRTSSEFVSHSEHDRIINRQNDVSKVL